MADLREAFREAARREFAAVPPEAELDYTFSPRFERSMRRIIRAQAYGYWMLVNTAAKRVAIAAALLILLLTSVMAIKPVRERVIQFFIEVYEDYFEIHFGEEESWDLPERTEPMVRYTLTELPEGYEETNFIMFEHILWTEWKNPDGKTVTLQQESGTHEIITDNDLPLSTLMYGDLVITKQSENGTDLYIWEENGYIFQLYIYGNLSEETVLQIINSRKIQ